MNIKILHIYPDLLNLYGDKGNIASLQRRLLWRDIEVEVIAHTSDEKELCSLDDIDIVFIGGGSDREEKLAAQKLANYRDALKQYVENNGGLKVLGFWTYIQRMTKKDL